jgi:alpha-N-arabinofuranosidase
MLKSVLAAAIVAMLTIASGTMAETVAVTGSLKADMQGPTISRNIYGQFVEHLGRGVYEGIWVGPDSPIPNTRGIRNDVVAALKALEVPVVRWPGGCFADDYHWRDGVGPQRKNSINASWNRAPEPNTFGTHEFMDFLGQIGAEPYISVNVGSGSPQEGEAWLQYMTAPASTGPGAERAANGHPEPWKVPYVGVGNESWGCGGNMYPVAYVDEFRKFVPFLKTVSGPRPQLMAVGPDTDDYEWTETVMKQATIWRPNPTPLMYTTTQPLMAGLSLHYYTLPTNKWDKKGIATGFGEDQWISTLKRAQFMDELVTKHGAIMDKYDPGKKVALVVDEWGTWYDGEPKGPGGLYQQNTLRDALVAAVTFNVFQNHADRVRMANIAQMVNVLQSMVLTRGDKIVLTPTYYVFQMYKVHRDATALPLDFKSPVYSFNGVDVPMLTASASRDAKGMVHVSIANLDPHRDAAFTLNVSGLKASKVSGTVITAPAMDSFNDFGAMPVVAPKPVTGAAVKGNVLSVNLPAKSVTTLTLE